MSNKIIEEALSYSMGADLHEAWRASRSVEKYEPRMKKSKDEKWNQEHGTDDVDIANLTFSELPSNWQYENLEAAKVAVAQVFEKIMSGEEITPEVIEQMSSEVHEEWLKRNDYARGGDLDVPYDVLPEEEKAKDRVQIMQAIEKVQAYQRGEIDIDIIIEEYGLTVEPEEIGITEATKGVKQGEMNKVIDEMVTEKQNKEENTQAIGEE